MKGTIFLNITYISNINYYIKILFLESHPLVLLIITISIIKKLKTLEIE